ncbi:unnamed protein product [Allacma fusca]|uniref:Uncharacterized protein n=1 Tax=Allacma fusca TaxID=39272 RepID=A0A8J2LCL7_9HEXA|nr:unnamed protein product [Allacma fusca]
MNLSGRKTHLCLKELEPCHSPKRSQELYKDFKLEIQSERDKDADSSPLSTTTHYTLHTLETGVSLNKKWVEKRGESPHRRKSSKESPGLGFHNGSMQTGRE